MAKPRRRSRIDHTMQSHEMTHTLLAAKSIDELARIIDHQTSFLSPKEESLVLAMTVGNLLALVNEMRSLPGGEATIQDFAQKVGDLIITNRLAEVSQHVISS